MRLQVLHSGHDLVSSLFLRFIARMNRTEPTDVLKATFYRSRFYGTPFSDLVQETMRGPSFWTPGEREVFASYTSQTNDCAYCITAHRDFACSFLGEEVVDAALAAPDTSELRPEAKAVLVFLDKMSRSPEDLTAADVEAVRAQGVDNDALEQAVRVGVLLQVMNRILNAVGARPGDSEQRPVSVQAIRSFGYRLPAPVRLLSRSR